MKCPELCYGVTICVALLAAGCTTTRSSNTARTGMEQLLLSNAVDEALTRYDFSSLRGAAVFVDEKYLGGVTDANYISSSIRDLALRNGARLTTRDTADVVLEIRSGGVGTDLTESFVGMPGVALPGPMPVELPEVKLWNRNSQLGTAKIGIVAYDAKQGGMLAFGGNALARSDDNNWYVMGVGPFQSGSVRDEVFHATGTGGITTMATHAIGEVPTPAIMR